MLHTRIDELERRLVQLEENARESRPVEPAAAPPDDRREASERRFGRRATDRLNRISKLEEADAGREGARLVALEMLDAGHQPEQVAAYLHETFDLDEAAAALAVAGPMPD